jgi:hypothetical protein
LITRRSWAGPAAVIVVGEPQKSADGARRGARTTPRSLPYYPARRLGCEPARRGNGIVDQDRRPVVVVTRPALSRAGLGRLAEHVEVVLDDELLARHGGTIICSRRRTGW